MAIEDEPSVTSCAPGARTPKDQVRQRERPPSRIVASTEARGLSGQTTLTKRQQDDEAEIMSVGLNNPDRRRQQGADFRLYDSTDANFSTSELGKFCRRYHDSSGDYRTSTAYLRYCAGMVFAIIVNDDQIANGLPGLQRGDANWDGVPNEKSLDARKELCRMRRKGAEDVLRDMDRRGALPMGAWAMTTLCFDDRPLPEHLHALGVQLLYALSVHFGIERPGFHQSRGRFEDAGSKP